MRARDRFMMLTASFSGWRMRRDGVPAGKRRVRSRSSWTVAWTTITMKSSGLTSAHHFESSGSPAGPRCTPVGSAETKCENDRLERCRRSQVSKLASQPM
jgi:hypothetical protein